MAIIDGHIRCSKCGEMKPLSEYMPSYVRHGSGRCTPCNRIASYGKEWRKSASAEEIARVRAMTRRYYQANRAARLAGTRARRLADDFGMTESDFQSMLEAQGHRCACCGVAWAKGSKKFHIDHDHATGAIRGIVCGSCNLGVGSLGDTAASVRRALAYLEVPRPRVMPPVRINLLPRSSDG